MTAGHYRHALVVDNAPNGNPPVCIDAISDGRTLFQPHPPQPTHSSPAAPRSSLALARRHATGDLRGVRHHKIGQGQSKSHHETAMRRTSNPDTRRRGWRAPHEPRQRARERARGMSESPQATKRIGWGGCGGKLCPEVVESCCSHSHTQRIESAGEGVAERMGESHAVYLTPASKPDTCPRRRTST